MSEYKQMEGKCSCGSKGFSFKLKREATHRIEIYLTFHYQETIWFCAVNFHHMEENPSSKF